jgi:hypothetical protein
VTSSNFDSLQAGVENSLREQTGPFPAGPGQAEMVRVISSVVPNTWCCPLWVLVEKKLIQGKKTDRFKV